MLHQKTQWLISIASAAALFASVGCDGSASNTTPTNPGTTPAVNNTTPNGSTPEDFVLQNSSAGEIPEDNTEAIPAPPNPGLGEEEGQELIPAGHLNGVWRIATDDADDAPVVYLTFVHDKDATTATCDFEMSIGMSPQFDGHTGKCASASWQGETLTVTMNPTNDSEELWTITSSSKVDDDMFKGTVKKKKDAEFSLAVNVERRKDDPGDDGVRPAYNGN